MANFAGNVRPGDWNCGSCGAHNFASRNACFKCHAPKSEMGGGDGETFGVAGGGEDAALSNSGAFPGQMDGAAPAPSVLPMDTAPVQPEQQLGGLGNLGGFGMDGPYTG